VIVSPSRSGISRKAPLNSPENEKVISSSTASVPSSSIWTTTFASGSVKNLAAASPVNASAATRARPR